MFAINYLAAWSNRRQLEGDGFTVIRRFVPAYAAAKFRQTVDEIYAAMSAASDLGDQDLTDNFKRWHGVWLKALPQFLVSTHPSLARRYTELLNHIIAKTHEVTGREWKLIADRSFFRRHHGTAKTVPWHVDADAAATAVFGERCINVWMPFDAVGRELPSLEIVPQSHRTMRNIPLLTGQDRYREDDFVAKIGQASTPTLEPGDALIFDQYLLHRTQRVGFDGAIRTAGEFRFAVSFVADSDCTADRSGGA